METAFGRALLDSLGVQPQYFRISIDGMTMSASCAEFLSCRDEEKQLLQDIPLPCGATALDYGCGVARYLKFIRAERPDVHCIGLETCDLLRAHCSHSVSQPSAFYASLDEIPGGQRHFDLIILAGNGLGVLGNETSAKKRLAELIATLVPGGHMIIETGMPFGGHGYTSTKITTAYQDKQDDPFTWGQADRDWLEKTLAPLGCQTSFRNSHAPGNCFFFAIAQKNYPA